MIELDVNNVHYVPLGYLYFFLSNLKLVAVEDYAWLREAKALLLASFSPHNYSQFAWTHCVTGYT